MDVKKLFEAAYTGNVELLHEFRQGNPLILVDVALTSPQESLLHIATKAGQLGFVRELIKLSPALARESNKQDGFRPLDIASMAGNEEIVKEILEADSEICRLRGKDQRTALHYAAIEGRVGVINLLLSTCPNAVEDVTVHGENSLQLAVKNHQFEAFSDLLKRLENPSMEPLINWGDCDGNTVLHLAASRKHFEVVEVLLSNNSAIRGMVNVNATNLKGLTAMDLLDIVMDSPNDVHLREVLRRAGAVGARDVSPSPSTPSLHQVSQTQHVVAQSEPPTDWFEYFKFKLHRDSPGDARNALLVMAALIATVTFQAGVNPPTGLLKSTSQSSTLMMFLFANTLGLTASVTIITYLTGGFPFQRELLLSIYSIMFTYAVSISGITEKDKRITFVLTGIAFFLPFLIRFLPLLGQKVLKRWEQHYVRADPEIP